MGSVGGASAGSYDVPTIVRPSQGTRKRKRPSLLAAHRAGHHRRAAQHDVAGAQERGGGTPEPAAREELVRPGPGRVDDHAGADLRGRAAERVAHRDPGDPAPAPQERDGLRVVRRGGTRAGGGVEEAEREPLGARRLRVVPEGGAGEAARLEAGHEAQRLGGGDGPRRGDAVARRQAPVAVAGEPVVQEEAQREGLAPGRAVAVGRHDDRAAAARAPGRWPGASLARARTRAGGEGRASAGSACRRGSS